MTQAAEALRAIADGVLDRLAPDHPDLAARSGRPVERLPTLDADRIASTDGALSEALAALRRSDARALEPDPRAFRAALEVDLERRLAASATRRLDFCITPYRGGDLHVEARAALAGRPLATREDRRGYLDLVADYGRLLREMLAHTREQAAHGVRLPTPALPGARAALSALRDELPAILHPSSARLADATARLALTVEVERLVDAQLSPAIADLRAFLGDDYAAAAPQAVGFAQFRGGDAFYRAQVAALGDSALEPEAIHRLGMEALAELREEKAALRDRLAPTLDLAAFDRRMRDDPQARANDADDIERAFVRRLDRLEPLMAAWFGRRPAAPYAVTRADPAVERAMSFGYYQAPTAADPVGRYRYNGARPQGTSLLGAAHLIFHELVPGHHHQLSLQAEAQVAHPLQRSLMSMAALEGWAVYASGLGAEMGAMEPFDLYGHAVMQSFVAARLVVDTGLNALGWDLERAAAFLRDHTAEHEETIGREVLRYATDIPGQALAYGLGARAILGLRTQAQAALGAGFDVRGFHDALLRRGAYPIPVLEGVIGDWVAAGGPAA